MYILYGLVSAAFLKVRKHVIDLLFGNAAVEPFIGEGMVVSASVQHIRKDIILAKTNLIRITEMQLQGLGVEINDGGENNLCGMQKQDTHKDIEIYLLGRPVLRRI